MLRPEGVGTTTAGLPLNTVTDTRAHPYRHNQAELVVAENGKNKAEALASVAKGNETVEWACSMPQLMQGKILQVSRGIDCRDLREPLGVVASLVVSE